MTSGERTKHRAAKSLRGRWGAPTATVAVAIAALVITTLPAQASTRSSSSRSWIARPEDHHAVAGLGVEQTDGVILAIGGFNASGFTGATEARSVGAPGVWHRVAPMPTARGDFASAVVDGLVYVAGGYDNSDETSAVERYDVALNRWTTIRPLPQPRGGDSGASLGGLFYVAGGYVTPAAGPDQLTASVLAYDPRRDAWTSVAPMHTARERLRLVQAGGFLYAVGGVNARGASLTTVERYNPRTNTWVTIAPLNESRAFPGIVATTITGHSVIVVVGGGVYDAAGNFVGPRRTTEVLNITTGTWHTLDVLLDFGRGGLSLAVAAGGAVLAISGGTIVDGQSAYVSDVSALKLEPRDLR
jgi:N-acetylneuraminic acid mutarotase